MRCVLEKLAVICSHRMESLKVPFCIVHPVVITVEFS